MQCKDFKDLCLEDFHLHELLNKRLKMFKHIIKLILIMLIIEFHLMLWMRYSKHVKHSLLIYLQCVNYQQNMPKELRLWIEIFY